jgi:hypothetical protein
MNGTPPKPAVGTPAESREERLKAALKANLSRRKAQARAKAAARDRADRGGDS